MTTKPATTNGEYYDHATRQWFVMCGPDNVPIRKVSTDGKPVVPEKMTPADSLTAVDGQRNE